MRVDLPTCDLKKCRYYSDYNCTDEYAYGTCEYTKLRKQISENGYIVENGLLQHKIAYLFNVSEDKSKENAVDNLIKDLWNMFISLEQTHPSDVDDFRHGIHELQKVIGMRKLRRLLPKEYPTFTKVNGEWVIK